MLLSTQNISKSRRRSYRVNADGSQLSARSEPSLPKILDISGDRFNSASPLRFRVPYTGNSEIVRVRATNIRVLGIAQKRSLWITRCRKQINDPPFRGGQIDTQWILSFTYIRAGMQITEDALVEGKLSSPAVEFFFQNGQQKLGYRTSQRMFLLLNEGDDRIRAPRITRIRRLDGNPSLGPDLVIPDHRYYCQLPTGPTWNASLPSDRVPNRNPRVGQVFAERGTNLFVNLNRNLSGRWRFEVLA